MQNEISKTILDSIIYHRKPDIYHPELSNQFQNHIQRKMRKEFYLEKLSGTTIES